MQAEVKNCQNCKKDFIIESEDFNFYEKIKVPAPTWCPECRMIRRLSCCNSWYLFWRNCDKCNIDIYTPYSSDRPETVYCVKCYQQEFN